jgi:hypothetical protein
MGQGSPLDAAGHGLAGPGAPGGGSGDDNDPHRLPTVEELLHRVHLERQSQDSPMPQGPQTQQQPPAPERPPAGDPLNDPLSAPLSAPVPDPLSAPVNDPLSAPLSGPMSGSGPSRGFDAARSGNGGAMGGPDPLGASFGSSGFSPGPVSSPTGNPGTPAGAGAPGGSYGTGGDRWSGSGQESSFGYGNDQLRVPGAGENIGANLGGAPQPEMPMAGYSSGFPSPASSPGQSPSREPGPYGDFSGASYSNGANSPLHAAGPGQHTAMQQPTPQQPTSQIPAAQQPTPGFDSPVGLDYYGAGDSGYGGASAGYDSGRQASNPGGPTPEPQASHYGGDPRQRDRDSYGGGGYSR